VCCGVMFDITRGARNQRKARLNGLAPPTSETLPPRKSRKRHVVNTSLYA
jgi:hypothetical protein